MNRKLKNALLFVSVAWPIMMIAAYLFHLSGAFSGTNLLIFGVLGLPALFIARFLSLHVFERFKT